MECNKRSRNICYAIFRDSNLNRILNVLLNRTRSFSRTFMIDLANYKGSFRFWTHYFFLYIWLICQNEMIQFFENGPKMF